ncbi:hypothetical protein QFZ30_001758 [Arthrobacter pascens]|uniref:hypothetical protein n=1 Tax=Arthrobacter pascens TaxID=1677 RepID=UPI0027920D7D|nr:hypothetical protein [Arthrobacter pascens]MDQ0678376.1 hypothetical protein [Arthrobacter pascens]
MSLARVCAVQGRGVAHDAGQAGSPASARVERPRITAEGARVSGTMILPAIGMPLARVAWTEPPHTRRA